MYQHLHNNIFYISEYLVYICICSIKYYIKPEISMITSI